MFESVFLKRAIHSQKSTNFLGVKAAYCQAALEKLNHLQSPKMLDLFDLASFLDLVPKLLCCFHLLLV